MPYKTFKKTFKRNYRKNMSKMSLAAKAYKIAKRVDRRAEVKYTNTNYSTTLATGGFTTYDLCPIAQGDGPGEREGNEVEVKSVSVRIALDSSPNSGVLTPNAVRIVVVRDNQQEPSVLPPGTDVFFNNGDWNSHINNPQQTGRFTVLKDTTVMTTPNTLAELSGFITTGSYSIATLKEIKFKIKGGTKKLRWDNVNGNNHQKNGLYMLMQNSNGGYNTTPYISIQTKFIDQ